MANYSKTNIGNEGRVELHEKLALTGAEISIPSNAKREALRGLTGASPVSTFND